MRERARGRERVRKTKCGLFPQKNEITRTIQHRARALTRMDLLSLHYSQNESDDENLSNETQEVAELAASVDWAYHASSLFFSDEYENEDDATQSPKPPGVVETAGGRVCVTNPSALMRMRAN